MHKLNLVNYTNVIFFKYFLFGLSQLFVSQFMAYGEDAVGEPWRGHTLLHNRKAFFFLQRAHGREAGGIRDPHPSQLAQTTGSSLFPLSNHHHPGF